MKIIIKCLECKNSWREEKDTVFECPFCHSAVIYPMPGKMTMEL